ncbi:ABC transporter ATP-binding protein [Deinococcus daejeonensis]|uniref:Aliphatic sulfonates import ATP-binding protein SsuB 1 n=1 Tax=Deinococcus daejeonensis TaxID=1007098 RepID=A0ABQ2JH28_9DEIO|nr:ABC transporter ATP-binding protein [Deinococcus daejeonensis]GGN45834.1 aliphatic sulfonates import ATP-binding protein SsuB 1 [Deinococcus daejeonensis]
MTAAPVLTSAPTSAGVPIDLRGLSASYGEHVILRDLNLSVAPGERVALVGASGGGKTTLLRALAGLIPTQGTLRVGTGGPVCTRVMFQEDRLLPWLGALDNVALGLPRLDRLRAIRALRDVGLAGRERAYPHELSGGQRQRVALARALAHRPDLLLLDEPFGALDALTRADMHNLLDTLLTDTGATTLLVTHDLDEALKLTDRVLLLRAGQVALDLPVPLARPRRRLDTEQLRAHLETQLH